MRHYYNKLEDYRDPDRQPLTDFVYWLIPRLLMAGAMVMMLLVCAVLEGM